MPRGNETKRKAFIDVNVMSNTGATREVATVRPSLDLDFRGILAMVGYAIRPRRSGERKNVQRRVRKCPSKGSATCRSKKWTPKCGRKWSAVSAKARRGRKARPFARMYPPVFGFSPI